MNLTELVQAAMRDLTPVHETGDGVLVTTLCLYPSDSFVQVAVRGGSNAFMVSDEGGAIDEVVGAGVHMGNADAALKHLMPSSCTIQHGVIRSRCPVSLDELPVMIATIANASKEAAEYVYERHTIKRARNFKFRRLGSSR
jgi:hypothetical protein